MSHDASQHRNLRDPGFTVESAIARSEFDISAYPSTAHDLELCCSLVADSRSSQNRFLTNWFQIFRVRHFLGTRLTHRYWVRTVHLAQSTIILLILVFSLWIFPSCLKSSLKVDYKRSYILHIFYYWFVPFLWLMPS